MTDEFEALVDEHTTLPQATQRLWNNHEIREYKTRQRTRTTTKSKRANEVERWMIRETHATVLPDLKFKNS